jgi:hypothetical protein
MVGPCLGGVLFWGSPSLGPAKAADYVFTTVYYFGYLYLFITLRFPSIFLLLNLSL